MATSRPPVEHVPTDDEINTELRKLKWGKTYLTEFLQSAETNIKISYVNLRGYFEMLEGIGNIFNEYQSVISSSNKTNLSTDLLFGRACGNFLASVRLSTSGQLSETYVQLRSCLESAIYAFYIHNNAARADIWLDRHNSKEHKKNCKQVFQIGNMLKDLIARDIQLGTQVNTQYNMCIDYGAHPNERSAFSNLSIKMNGDRSSIAFQFLNSDKVFFNACLLNCVFIGILVIKVFSFIYDDKFKTINIGLKLDGIEQELRRIAPSVVYEGKYSDIGRRKVKKKH